MSESKQTVANKGLVRQEAKGGVESNLPIDEGKSSSGDSLFNSSVVGVGLDQRMVIGGGAKGSLEEDDVDTLYARWFL